MDDAENTGLCYFSSDENKVARNNYYAAQL